jgi:outer membrane immunogenic protein
MKKILLALIASTSFLLAANAGATGFDGFYAGVKAGDNVSSTSGAADPRAGTAFGGGEAGYNSSQDEFLVGVDVWADNHRRSVTGRDWGADFKVGQVQKRTLYYLKMGVAASDPGTRPHVGAGVEYKLARSWGALAEVTHDVKTRDGITYSNWNYVAGVMYHF